MLNTNGSAAWIVFDSINGLDTGTGGIIDDNNRNVIHNGNVALWGDNTVVVNGVSISYNYNQSSAAYSFVVPGANIGDVINYNVEARVNGQTVNVKNNVQLASFPRMSAATWLWSVLSTCPPPPSTTWTSRCITR